MCVNDILANGGEPLFFLDYMASSKINDKSFLELITSITKACKKSNCSLVGGETAEMPGMYKVGEFDLAGFAVGVVERKNLLIKDKVNSECVIIGLESSGFHSNGYSLIRKILKKFKINLKSPPPYKSKSKHFADDLLLPTKIYVDEILPLVKENLICSAAHITGGGIFENLSRAIPDKFQAEIDCHDFKIPNRFLWLKKKGDIDEKEMLQTFNCGIGMILLVKKKSLEKVKKFFCKKKIKWHLLGNINKKVSANKVIIKKFGSWNLG